MDFRTSDRPTEISTSRETQTPPGNSGGPRSDLATSYGIISFVVVVDVLVDVVLVDVVLVVVLVVVLIVVVLLAQATEEEEGCYSTMANEARRLPSWARRSSYSKTARRGALQR